VDEVEVSLVVRDEVEVSLVVRDDVEVALVVRAEVEVSLVVAMLLDEELLDDVLELVVDVELTLVDVLVGQTPATVTRSPGWMALQSRPGFRLRKLASVRPLFLAMRSHHSPLFTTTWVQPGGVGVPVGTGTTMLFRAS
jgi:hypothetical protein